MPGILGRLASWRRGGSSAYSQPSQSEASVAEGGGSSSYVRHPLERSATEESRSSAPLALPAHFPVAAAAGAPSRGIQGSVQEGRPAAGRSSGRSRQFTGAGGRALFRTRSRASLAHDHRWQQQSYARRSSMRSGGGGDSSGVNSSLSEAASSRGFGGGSAAEEGSRPAYVDEMLAAQLREQSWARPNFYSGNSSLKDSFLEPPPRDSPRGPPLTSSQVPVTDAFGAPISPRTTALLAELENQDNAAGQRGGAAADSLAEALRRDRVEFESSFLEPEDKEVYFTPIIVFVNFVCFMWQMGEAGWELAPYAQNPFLGPTSAQLLDNGSQLTACLHGPFRQWWRLITSQFLHAGLVHFLMNMLALWAIGPPLEMIFGWWRVAAIYFTSGYVAALTTALLLPRAVCLGASGAILGLFGSEWADFFANWKAWRHYRREKFCALFIPTAATLITSLLPFVNFFAHLSGSVAGTLIGLLLVIRRRFTYQGIEKEVLPRTVALAAAGVALTLAMVVGQTSLLYSTDYTHAYCPGCSALCIPSPLWDCGATNSAQRCGYLYFQVSGLVYELECPDGNVYQNDTGTSFGIHTTDSELLAVRCDQLCPADC